MSTTTHTARTDRERRAHVPAYGPVNAVLGYVVFFVFVERATPTVVEVFTEAMPDLSPGVVRLGLAMALWFVLAVTLLDQVRRQLAALGLVSHDAVRLDDRSGGVPSEAATLGYLALVLVGGLVAVWTFERAVETGITMVRVVGTVDVGAFVVADALVLVLFFAAFGAASYAVDRLVVGGVRALLAE